MQNVADHHPSTQFQLSLLVPLEAHHLEEDGPDHLNIGGEDAAPILRVVKRALHAITIVGEILPHNDGHARHPAIAALHRLARAMRVHTGIDNVDRQESMKATLELKGEWNLPQNLGISRIHGNVSPTHQDRRSPTLHYREGEANTVLNVARLPSREMIVWWGQD